MQASHFYLCPDRCPDWHARSHPNHAPVGTLMCSKQRRWWTPWRRRCVPWTLRAGWLTGWVAAVCTSAPEKLGSAQPDRRKETWMGALHADLSGCPTRDRSGLYGYRGSCSSWGTRIQHCNPACKSRRMMILLISFGEGAALRTRGWEDLQWVRRQWCL